MTLRIKFAIGVAVAVIVLPIIIVQAQSEGGEQPAATEETAAVEQPVVEVTPPEAPAAGPPQETAQEEVDTPDDVPAEGEAPDDSGTTDQEASGSLTEQPTTTPPVVEGSVLGEATTTEAVPNSETPGGENDSAASQPATTTVETDFLVETASTTEATSTPPVEEPKPVEEPLVLQPGVALMSINGNTVSAVVTLQNLTCSDCGKELPEVEVLTYYTAWYPNDGPIGDYAEASAKTGSRTQSVADVPVKATRDLSWSAEVPAGRYYFVVEVDPGNANGAYRLFRSEFAI